MGRIQRMFIRHQQPKPANYDGTTSVYCRQCGREVIRQARALIRTVTKCQICIMKEQGIENPEDHVLAQYQLSQDANRIPVPLDLDDAMSSGVLILYPEARLEQDGVIPQSGGVVGTVKSIFKVLGLIKPEDPVPVKSKETAVQKRKRGLYE